MNERVVLQHARDDQGIRHLEASLTASADLIIQGQDLGPGVERFFGQGLREYEYTITVRKADVPALLSALGAKDDVLGALQRHFLNPKSGDPRSFLDEHGIPHDFWSRIGD